MINSLRVSLVAGMAFATGFSIPSHATNGDQMLGVNAIQWGMAGAVIAAPQEAGTVFTNPAGIAMLDVEEFRLDMGIGFMNPVRDINGLDSETDLYLIPAGAVVFDSHDKLRFGVGMGGLSGQGVNFSDVSPALGAQPVVTTKQFFKIAPAVGYRVNDNLGVGAAFHINWQSLALYNAAFQLPQDTVFGYGFALGLNYRTSPQWRIGATYISEQSMDAHDWNTTTGRYSLTLDAPQQLALGVAYTPDDASLYELDVRRISFSDVTGTETLQTPAGPVKLAFGWDDQTVIALAAQRELSDSLTIRGGLNYGESPIGPEDVTANLGSLAVTEWHASLGVTRKMSKHLYSSFSYTHAFENRVTSTDGTTEIGLSQNVIYLQLSYR